MPADSDTLTFVPCSHTGANFINDARDFVTWNARKLDSRQHSFFYEHIAVADATGLDLNAHLSRSGLRNFALDNFELSPRLGNLCSLHGCYFWFRCHSERCHIASSDFVLQSPLSTVL